MCAVCDTCAHSAAIFRSNTSVTSTYRLTSEAAPAITHTSPTVHSSSPSAASSRWAKGLRASG